MATYTWANTNRPALGSMTSTTKFDDVGAGDRTTNETTTTGLTGGGPTYTGTGYLTAVCDLGSSSSISAWQATCRPTTPNNPGNVPGANANYTLESSPDGSSWTSRATGTLTEDTYNDISGSFSAVTARYWRLVLDNTGLSNISSATFTTLLSDFRVSADAPCNPPTKPSITATPVLVGQTLLGYGGTPHIYLTGN